jgi:hypothetical protein
MQQVGLHASYQHMRIFELLEKRRAGRRRISDTFFFRTGLTHGLICAGTDKMIAKRRYQFIFRPRVLISASLA